MYNYTQPVGSGTGTASLAATFGDSHNNNMQSVLVVVQQIKRAKEHVRAFLIDWNNEKYQPSRN